MDKELSRTRDSYVDPVCYVISKERAIMLISTGHATHRKVGNYLGASS